MAFRARFLDNLFALRSSDAKRARVRTYEGTSNRQYVICNQPNIRFSFDA